MSTPITSIVVGTDGSEASARGVEVASQLAAQLQCTVHVVHAVGLLEYFAGASDNPAGLLASACDEAEALLETTWSQPVRLAGVNLETHLEHGPPLLVLPRVAQQTGAGMIAVASHGRGAAGLLPMGSTSHGLVQSSAVPVLVIPTRG